MSDYSETEDTADDAWEIVRTVGTDEEAALVAGFLRSRDITVEIESLLFHQEPVTFGRLGEVRIRVPAEEADRALELLDELDEAALDEGEIDEGEIDEGEPDEGEEAP